jgi:hypothetical protein
MALGLSKVLRLRLQSNPPKFELSAIGLAPIRSRDSDLLLYSRWHQAERLEFFPFD